MLREGDEPSSVGELDCSASGSTIDPARLPIDRLIIGSDGSVATLGPFATIGQWSISPQRLSETVSRALDIGFAVLMMIAVAPALLLLVVLLQFDAPGPVLFIQQRIGKDGATFPCLKLRTMVTDAAERLEHLLATDAAALGEWQLDHKLKNDPRVTKLGHFARRFSLDELPQLANILVGHMSIVGPRPIVADEAWRYGVHFKDYCSVRPGLTGLWQVSGRNNVSYAKRVRLDRAYARSRCLALDLKIMMKTVVVVLGARGAY